MERIRARSYAAEGDLGPRIAAVAAGLWLFVSAFLWPHTEAQRGNCFVVGFVILAVAAIGGRTLQTRFIHAIAAAWLFISGFALRTLTPDTIVNDVFVAIVVFATSLTDGIPPLERGRPVERRAVR